MAEQRYARPVSGEIMTGAGPAPSDMPNRDRDVVEAEFEVLPGQPAGTSAPSSRGERPSAAPEGMDMLRRAEPQVSRRRGLPGGPAFWTAGISLALVAFWVCGGHMLVRQASALAQHGEEAALSISGVTSRVDSSGPKSVLIVDGEAGNDGVAAAALPPLAVNVTGNDGRITRYRLGTSGRPLAPGERFAFSSRVEVPRNGVTAVSVSFAE